MSNLTICLLVFLKVFTFKANAKENYEDYWKTINQDAIFQYCAGCSSGIKFIQKEECGFASCENVCYDRSGNNIGDERCNKIWNWSDKDAKNIQRLESDLGSEILTSCGGVTKKCLKEHEKALIKMKNVKVSFGAVGDDIKLNMKEFYAHVVSKLDKDIQSKVDEIANINGTGANQKILSKMKSKECQVYHLTSDICQKSYVESTADAAMGLEKEATKQSGIINKYGRYKIGQMKAMHGTNQITQLKSKFKRLNGKDWTPKSCDSSGESDGSEEITACGCTMMGTFADCPLEND